MSSVAAKSWGVLFLFLAIFMMGMAHLADRVSGADVRVAAVTPDAAKPHMTPLPQIAQARCPGGRLVFLSRACGCNGACCLCSREAPYLNHCTCRCEAVPTACARGHSAGNP